MTGIEATFWMSLLVITYAYVGYPAILWLISGAGILGKRSVADQDGHKRTVTMIVSAYNEEKVIGEKIENALSLDYPRELLEIVVVSDGSTDRTREIALNFAHCGVVLRHYEGRIGKSACLNRAVPLAAGNIVVLSDANSMYEQGALRALLGPFQDDTVGFVTGWTRYGSSGEAGASGSTGIGIYSKLELLIKGLESRLGSCIGADGAIFAIRKELYRSLEDYDINDLVIPLSINLQGYRGVLEPGAICVEKDAGSSRGEFQRQVRITSRTIRAIMNYRGLLNPLRFGLLSFEIVSHKLCRFVAPVFLVTLAVSNLLLASGGGLFLAALAAQGIVYGAAGAAGFVSSEGLLSRVATAARTFVVVNAAMAMAWVKYWQGETYTTWSPTKR
jgi:cellulose synthase/poly-beta-1,6-N-acetylglucosamine synthase-like glycosyltransferase